MDTESTHFDDAASGRSRLAQRGFSALRWVLGLLALLVLLMVLTLVVIAHWDWNSARPWVAQQVSQSTGRDFRIDGDLTADWHWPQPLEQGFRRWIPGVTVQAQNIVLGNPDGFLVEDEPARGNAELPALPAKSRPSGKPSSLAASVAKPATPNSSPARSKEMADKPPTTTSAAPAQAAVDVPSELADAEDARRLMQRERAHLDVEAPTRTASTMLTIARATATLRLLPLLQRTIALDTVVLTAPDIALARNKQGESNWQFKSAGPSSGEDWNLSLGQLIVRGGWLGYADGVKDLSLRAYIDTFEPDEDSQGEQNSDESGDSQRPVYGVHMTLQGRYGKARIEGEGLAGPILSLRKTTLDYPVHIKLRAGSLRAEAEGILANPRELSGLDMQVSLRGASMADLYPLTGLVLPSTPAFKTRGRLLGSLAPGKAVWEYRDFDGVVGASDLHGSLTYTSAQPRLRLEGRMLSKKLRLVDLGPLVGNSSTQEVTLRRKGRVLPDAPFDTGRWNAMDMDIAFTGERIIRQANLPIENLSTRAILKDAQLSLSPLRFGVAHGKINADLHLDSRDKPLKVRMNGSVSKLQLGAMFPKVELMKKSFGQLDGAFSLVTQGNSVASMLGGSTGEVKLFVRDGALSKEMLDLAALNLGSVVITKLFGAQKEVQLRCAVADFAVRDGLATTRVAKLSTEEAIVEATGNINLKNETLDLNIKPESLKWKFFSLRTPLYVKGSFAEPDVGLEKGPLILRAGAAVIAAVAAPVALALVPVTVPAAQDDADCKALLAAVTKPGKP